MSRGGDFWTRRKAGVEAEAQASEDALLAEEQAAEMAELEAQSDEELLATLNLPDPDSLTKGDDFSGFMAKAVPDRLRRRALRRLWLSNSVLANVDGLVDYGEDFTDAACVIENLQTAYQVGKGMTAHVEEMARQAALEDEAEAEPTEELEAEPETEEATVGLAEAVPDEAPEPIEVAVSDADEEPPAPRRRMQFQFETQPAEGAQA